MVSKLIEEYKWGFFQDKSIGPHGPPPSATTETQALLWSCEIYHLQLVIRKCYGNLCFLSSLSNRRDTEDSEG